MEILQSLMFEYLDFPRTPTVFRSIRRQPPRQRTPPAPNAVNLPDELFFVTFQIVKSSTHTSEAYKNLLNFQLVCRQWERVAIPLLYHQVELATRKDVPALYRTLTSRSTKISGHMIKMLAVGIADSWNLSVSNESHLDKLLHLTPELRQLVIFNVEFRSTSKRRNSFKNLSRLPNLLDVTIMSANALDPDPTASAIIRGLPSQIKFLQLPGSHIPCPQLSSKSPAFHLLSLTIQEYPSPMAEWVLASSGESLQSLTVGKVTDMSLLAISHPNLRSLRILDRIEGCLEGLRQLVYLERLELRAYYARSSILQTLPDGITYMRFWSRDLATGLEDALGTPSWQRTRQLLPNLQTVIWDRGSPWGEDEDDEDEDGTLKGLQEACQDKGIVLRSYRRTDSGTETTQGHDLQYEANFRTTCFNIDPPSTGSIFLPASLKYPSIQLPTHVLTKMINNGIILSSLFTTQSSWTPACLFETLFKDSFDDSLNWVSGTLPEVQKEADGRKIVSMELPDDEKWLLKLLDTLIAVMLTSMVFVFVYLGWTMDDPESVVMLGYSGIWEIRFAGHETSRASGAWFPQRPSIYIWINVAYLIVLAILAVVGSLRLGHAVWRAICAVGSVLFCLEGVIFFVEKLLMFQSAEFLQ